MTTTTIGIIIIVGLVLAAAAFLRWHTVPLGIAHRIRRRADIPSPAAVPARPRRNSTPRGRRAKPVSGARTAWLFPGHARHW